VSQDVASHYSDSDALVESIAASLRAAGIDPASATTADLVGVDEFHIRGREATLALAESMGISADTSVLDIGSGLGGTARTLAEVFGCTVTGSDRALALDGPRRQDNLPRRRRVRAAL
jgi:cyclopropane fatty-acyl-phospholipid synthase-like methyltransferase